MCSGNQWLWQVCFLLFVNIVYSRLFNSTERIKQDINPKKKVQITRNVYLKTASY